MKPVEALVHSPKRVEATHVSEVGVVDDAVGMCKCAHIRRLGGVGGDISAVIAAKLHTQDFGGGKSRSARIRS
jgi:hypothetical protein